MKCKAVVSGLSVELVRNTLDGLRPMILDRVVGPHLHRPHLSSAEFYVQWCDEADDNTHDPFCEVRLSGVSVTDDRSVQDFRNARDELERVYYEAIARHPRDAKKGVRLFVSIMLDTSPKPGMSSLVEGEVVLICEE